MDASTLSNVSMPESDKNYMIGLNIRIIQIDMNFVMMF